VAKEFKSKAHGELLEYTDLYTTTETMDRRLENQIMQEAVTGNGRLTESGSYVNADFHVKYKVFLEIANRKRIVDIGGLPLRYYWVKATDGSVRIRQVKVFTFPADVGDREARALQDRAVMFFQTAAVLRQFSRDNPPEFNRFLQELEQLISSPRVG